MFQNGSDRQRQSSDQLLSITLIFSAAEHFLSSDFKKSFDKLSSGQDFQRRRKLSNIHDFSTSSHAYLLTAWCSQNIPCRHGALR